MNAHPDDHEQPENEASQAEAPEEGGEEAVGFWRRMFGGKPRADEAEESEPADGDGETTQATPAPTKNQPRRSRKTIFDRAEQEQRRHYARAAMLRRERLAKQIGEKVERVISERMETGEEKLAQVAGSFGEVRSLLGAIGRNLDDQSQRSERVAKVLEGMPLSAEREVEVLQGIADALEIQSGAQQEMVHAVRSVPEVVALARHSREDGQERLEVLRGVHQELVVQRTQGERAIEEGQERLMVLRGVQEELLAQREQRERAIGEAQERLLAIRNVEHELLAQRDQRQQVIETLQRTTARFEERMGRLEEAIVHGHTKARQDVDALRSTLEEGTERLLDQGRAESQREEQRAARMEVGLAGLSAHLQDGNQLAHASVQAQGQALDVMQGSHEEMVRTLQGSHGEMVRTMQDSQEEMARAMLATQEQTWAEMQRMHEELQDGADRLAWRGRMTLVGCAGVVAIFFASLLAPGADAPQAPAAPAAATAPAAPAATGPAMAEASQGTREAAPAAARKPPLAPRVRFGASLPAGYQRAEEEPAEPLTSDDF
jgi:hypothetical protein